MSQRQFDTESQATGKSTLVQQVEAPNAEIAVAADNAAHFSGALRLGSAPRPEAQTAALAQASGGQLTRAGSALLQLQRAYGNRYVQRVVNHARQADSPNRTGLPDRLKAGIESLSGISLDNVKVHYNSSQPAQLNALAYAQGRDIHVAPGEEQHLPHEAWHLVQQAQGRVQPTLQLKDGVPVNDDKGLEHEADVMGARALQQKNDPVQQRMPMQMLKPTLQRMTARVRRNEHRDPTPEEIAAAANAGIANSQRLAGHGRARHGRQVEVPADQQDQQAVADRQAAVEQAIQLKMQQEARTARPAQVGNNTASIQRKIVIEEPEYKSKEESLAEQMLAKGLKEPLGVTEPFLNGLSIFTKGPKLNEPSIAVDDIRAGIEYKLKYPSEEIPPLFDEDPEMSLDPRDVEGEQDWNKDRYRAWVDKEFTNTFSFKVYVPPRGRWEKDQVPGEELNKLISEVCEISKQEILPSVNAKIGKLVLKTGADDSDALVDHAQAHENQHVADHMQLIEDMVRPWDRYLESHSSKETAISSDDSLALRAKLMSAENYANSTIRIYEELKLQMMKSGKEFHETKEGRVPKLSVEKVSEDGTVTISVIPEIMLTDPNTLPNARYRWQGKKIQG